MALDIRTEALTIGTQNVFPALSATPADTTDVIFFINGTAYATVGTSPPLAVSGTSATWTAANVLPNGYNVPVGATVIAQYWVNI